MENITNEELTAANDEVSALEAREADGTLDEDGALFLEAVRDEFVANVLFGVPTVYQVRAEIAARGLVG